MCTRAPEADGPGSLNTVQYTAWGIRAGEGQGPSPSGRVRQRTTKTYPQSGSCSSRSGRAEPSSGRGCSILLNARSVACHGSEPTRKRAPAATRTPPPRGCVYLLISGRMEQFGTKPSCVETAALRQIAVVLLLSKSHAVPLLRWHTRFHCGICTRC